MNTFTGLSADPPSSTKSSREESGVGLPWSFAGYIFKPLKQSGNISWTNNTTFLEFINNIPGI
jgi:hypothetical protein